MTIYLTQGGGDEARVDEIEDKLKSTIPRPQARFRELKTSIRSRSTARNDRSSSWSRRRLRHANVDDLIDDVGRYPRNLFFIVVGGDISARDYKRLIQSGNADWVAEAGLPHEILDIVGRISAPGRETSRSTRRPWSPFTPSAGGVGNSTLAIETAIHLVKDKSTKGARVALVDLDFQSSHVCDYLDIAPKFQFEEIVAAPERLDDQLLSAFISRHSSGLDVSGRQAAAGFTLAISASRLCPPCSIAWRSDTRTSSSICRSRFIPGRSQCSRRRKGFWSPASTPFRA